jgi:hypothetical protein
VSGERSKKMFRHVLAGAIIFGLVSLAGATGLYYEAVTRVEGKQAQGMGDMLVKAWVSGDNAKIEFAESKNPMMGKGTYLMTHDGGTTVYLVNPKEKTYAVWDMAGMMGFAGGAMGMVNMKISDPTVEKLLEEAGGSMLGYPTTHYKYRTSYTMSMSVLGMKSQTKTVQEDDTWSTTALPEGALGVWLRSEPPSFGNEELDTLVKVEMGKVHGIPLKKVTVTTSADSKGKKSEPSTTTMEVTKLESMDVPAETFVIPADYQETSLFPAGMEEKEQTKKEESEQSSDNPFKKMLKRK